MEKRIITISREFGSGGRFIGEEVAKKLGISYYDKDIIGQIAEQSGFSPEYIRENAELSPKKGLFAYAFSGRDITGKSVEDMVYEAQRNVILKIAEKESCVIIGRNADFILKDREDVLNVFIHGDMPEKVQRIFTIIGAGMGTADTLTGEAVRALETAEAVFATKRLAALTAKAEVCAFSELAERAIQCTEKHIFQIKDFPDIYRRNIPK